MPVHPDAKGGKSHSGEQQALPDDQADELRREQRVLWVSRWALHDVQARRFQCQGKGGEDVGDQVEPQDMQRDQRQRPADHQSDEYRQDFRKVAGE